MKRATLRLLIFPQYDNNSILLLSNRCISNSMFYNRHQSRLVELNIYLIHVILYDKVIIQDILVTTSLTFTLPLSFFGR